MISHHDLVLGMLILTRVSVFIAFFPLFGKRQLPNLVKVGMAGALTVFWFAECKSNHFMPSDLGNVGSLVGVLLILREAFVGFVIAFTMGLFFWPAKIAGAYVGTELGLSMAAINDPASQDSSTLISAVFEALVILLFFATNFHHFFLLALHETFARFQSIDALGFPAEGIVQSLGQVPASGLMLIAPLIVLLGVLSLFIAYLNRAAPTLNLFTVGLPVRLSVGLFGLLWMSPTILAASQSYMLRVREDVEAIIGLLLR